MRKSVRRRRLSTKFKQDEARYQDREKIAQQVEDMRQQLRQSGSGSLLNLLVASDTRLEALRYMEFDHNSLLEAQHTLSSLIADRDAAVEQWNATVSQEIVTAQTSLDQAQAQLTKAIKHQDLVRLVAPEPSMVLSIARLSVGSVLKEGDPLLTLVPLRTPVEAEIQISQPRRGFCARGRSLHAKDRRVQFFRAWNGGGKGALDQRGFVYLGHRRQGGRAILQGAGQDREIEFHWKFLPTSG